MIPMLVLVVSLGACWTSTAPRAPAQAEVPRALAPALPAPVTAELGIIGDDGVLVPSADIPLFGGSTFGWRLELGCSAPVEIREQLRLPAPGDWGSDPDMTISRDGTLAEIRSVVPCTEGWIAKSWTVSPGDPPGVWVVRVTARGFAPQTFRASFARTPTPLPPTP